MWNKIYDKLMQLNFSKVGKTLFYTQIVFLIVLTYGIWYYAPRIAYFQNADEDSIWFGDGWSYVNQEGEPIAVNEHYLRIKECFTHFTKVQPHKLIIYFIPHSHTPIHIF